HLYVGGEHGDQQRNQPHRGRAPRAPREQPDTTNNLRNAADEDKRGVRRKPGRHHRSIEFRLCEMSHAADDENGSEDDGPDRHGFWLLLKGPFVLSGPFPGFSLISTGGSWPGVWA